MLPEQKDIRLEDGSNTVKEDSWKFTKTIKQTFEIIIKKTTENHCSQLEGTNFKVAWL